MVGFTNWISGERGERKRPRVRRATQLRLDCRSGLELSEASPKSAGLVPVDNAILADNAIVSASAKDVDFLPQRSCSPACGEQLS